MTWYAIVAPPDTPAAIADKINRDVTDIVNVPAVSDKIRDTLQMDPIGNTRAQARQLFVDDTELWAKVIKEANVTIHRPRKHAGDSLGGLVSDALVRWF